MSGKSSGGNKTTVVNNSGPPDWAKGYIKDNMKAVSRLPTAQAFDKPLHVGFDGLTRQGMGGLEQLANQSGGMMSKPLEYISGGLDQIQGDMQGNFSQPFMDVLARAQGDAMDSANLSMSSAGRYGSGAHSGAVTEAVGDVTANAMLGQMNNARNQLLDYAGAMPDAYETQMTPMQTLMQLGGMNEANQAGALSDEARRFYEAQDVPFDDLARRAAIYQGAGQLGRTGSSTTTTPGVNYGQAAVGYGLAGLGNSK
jgi:hypothetical protein